MTGAPRRVVFMGSPDFAVPSLDALCASGRYQPLLVVSQPDRPRGRGRALAPTAVRARAAELGIPTLAMEKSTYADGVRVVTDARPDLIVVVAFGLILRADLLDLPPHGCVNVHASLLPRFRGTSPVQAAILEGDAVTGCTTMRIDAGVDTGDILLQEATPIHANDTAGTLMDRLATLGAALLVRTLDGVFDGSVQPRAQDGSLATLTRRIKKEHGIVDWTRDASRVARQIRAMSPWPSAFTFHRGRRLILLTCEPATGPAAAPGTILALDPLTVACGDGALLIHTLQLEGKRALSARDFQAGHTLAVGDMLSPSSAS